MNICMRLAAVSVLVLCAHLALAGSPLKGIDVKLGKNPGGGCANRTTDGNGKANFGVWPKGDYTVSVEPAAVSGPSAQGTSRAENSSAQRASLASSKMHLTITGPSGGKIERDVLPVSGAAREVPLQFSLSGKEELVVAVTAAQ